MQHELRFELQGDIAGEFDRAKHAPDIEATAVFIVDAKHPAVLHLFLLLDALRSRDGDRQPLLDDQSVALTLDQDVTVLHFRGDHGLGIDAGLRWREGVVGKPHPIARPPLRGELHARSLDAPATDCPCDQLGVSALVQLGGLHTSVAIL